MKRLLALNYDITDACLGNEVEKVAEMISTGNFSDKAKMADIPSKADMDKLPEDKVALVLYHPQHGKINKYAHYNRELTELNVALLKDKAPNLPDEVVKIAANQLSKAARRWGVEFPNELQFPEEPPLLANGNTLSVHTDINELAYMKKLSASITPAKGYDEYALPDKKQYPIEDIIQIKAASAYFETYGNQLPTEDRVVFAFNTYKAAKENNVETSGYLEKYAHIRNKRNEDFQAHIRVRINNTRESAHRDLYEELNGKYKEIEPIKLAAALEKIDKHTGLDSLWNSKLEEPLVATLEMAKQAFITIEDKEINHDVLSKLSSVDLSGIIDNFTKEELLGVSGLDVLESLPHPVQDALIKKMEV